MIMTTLGASPGRSGVEIPEPAARRPPGPSGPVADRPRPVGVRTTDDRVALLGSLVGAGAFVWVAYDKLLPFSGPVGFIVCWYVTFLLLYWAVSAMSQPRPLVWDRLATAVVHGGAAVVFGAVATTVVYTFAEGWHALAHLNFFTHDMAGVAPTDSLTRGGVGHAIAGTLIQIGIAIVVSLPLGLATAVFITEVGGRFARGVRTVVEAMTALPDILAGLFIYTTLIVRLGVQSSGFAAAMALSVMMLPVIARSAEVVLRVVPGGLREASLALGASRWRTVWLVVLPTARAGLATALILGVARGIGETAPVLLTSGASTFYNFNPIAAPMNSLPLFIFNGFQSGQKLYADRLWGAASVLLGLVLILFITARALAGTRPGRA
jgi:phosphate transport system permease protein